MRAAVLRPGAFVVSGIERELLAVAHRAKPIGADADRDEIGARGDRPAFAQRQIVLGGPAFVAMSLDRDGPAWILLQHRGVVVEELLRFGRQLVAVEREEYRLERGNFRARQRQSGIA